MPRYNDISKNYSTRKDISRVLNCDENHERIERIENQGRCSVCE